MKFLFRFCERCSISVYFEGILDLDLDLDLDLGWLGFVVERGKEVPKGEMGKGFRGGNGNGNGNGFKKRE